MFFNLQKNLKKKWHIHISEYYSAIKRKNKLTYAGNNMNFTYIKLSERSQPQSQTNRLPESTYPTAYL